jgi:hypothetical protein
MMAFTCRSGLTKTHDRLRRLRADEVTFLRQVLKRAKRWRPSADDVANLPEIQNVVGEVLSKKYNCSCFAPLPASQNGARLIARASLPSAPLGAKWNPRRCAG